MRLKGFVFQRDGYILISGAAAERGLDVNKYKIKSNYFGVEEE